MGHPENGVYIIQGEVNLVVTAMRRNSRWSSHSHQDDEQDPLLNSFAHLKDILNSISDLQELAPNEFLSPFLEVIRSEDTTGPITGLALTSVNKFLSYGLIDANSVTAGAAIENIADAVTHARFVGTDPSNDEVILMKILHVLRTLLLTPAGAMLTNEAVCEIMQSCFRICFEMRLSELLRKSAEHTLMDMVQLLFSRLPQFKEDPKWATSLKKLKMRAGGMEQNRGRFRKRSPKPKHRKHMKGQAQSNHSQTDIVRTQPQNTECSPSPEHEVEISSEQTASADRHITNKDTEATEQCYDQIQPPDSLPTPPQSNVTSPEEYPSSETPTIATTPCDEDNNRTVVDIQKDFKDASDMENAEQQNNDTTNADHYLNVPKEDRQGGSGSDQESNTDAGRLDILQEVPEDGDSVHSTAEMSDGASVQDNPEYVNPHGVRFMPHHAQSKDGTGPLIPYGLPCVRELFRFLVSLTNPIDRHNTDIMIDMGLRLLTVALESGADYITSFSSLTCLVKDDMCKNLFFLLQSDRLLLFASSIRVCFLLFESMRSILKFQLEMYLTKLMEIIVSDSPRVSYEQREVALESIVQLLRIPGLVTELYLNYDCDLYCSNLFEDLMKLLSKNAFPVSGLYTTHLLSLDALLAVIDSIEQHCHHRVLHTSKKDEDKEGSDPDNVRTGSSTLISEQDDLAVPPTPPPSGYSVAGKMQALTDLDIDDIKQKGKDVRSGPRIRPNRMKVSSDIPTEEVLAAIKHKKKLYHTGSEQFNIKPSKGIAFLQSHGLLKDPIDPGEIVVFLKENPKLDKRQIGEYISDRKNTVILEAFQKSFNFDGVRIDEALRMYLETFRLPGEAPVIARLLEYFAEHWHKMNGEPFANTDAAFTLAYAVLMLNTDQHNTNAKKQNVPMTAEEFKKNLRTVNGGQDFDEDMLEEIFNSIKNEEIVMPSEQQGIVRENYLWKMMIRRGTYKEGVFTHAPTGAFDRDLFVIVWGPTVAALSFVFDKSVDEPIIQKAICGFRKCAMISAHYGISDVFDNLVISLCKFTTLLSSAESAETIPISFGNNNKAQLAARTVFGLAHRHGDILREGWKNIIDCLLQLYRAKMLPEVLVKVDDFIDPSGKISLIREETSTNQRSESGVLSSFYSYFTLTESMPQRGPTPEEQEATKRAHKCIADCHIEQLIQESKFLRVDSLQELLKALIFASQCPEIHDSMNGMSRCDEDSAVFFLELLIKVVLQNKDRICPFWQSIRDHIYNLAVNATAPTFLVERTVVALLRLAIRLLRREEIAPQVLASLRILLMVKPSVIHAVSRQVAYGLHDLLKTNAANIHSMTDWFTLFTLLEVVGAGTNPPPLMQVGPDGSGIQSDLVTESGAQSDSELTTSSTQASSEGGERGYTSDSELYESASHHSNKVNAAGTNNRTNINGEMEIRPLPDSHGSWVLQFDPVDSKLDNTSNKVFNKQHPDHLLPSPDDSADPKNRTLRRNQYSIDLNESLTSHDPKSLMKCCETLAFLVRDAAHITPHNFESCVHTIRTFVEASLNGGHPIKTVSKHSPSTEKKKSLRKKKTDGSMSRSKSSPSHLTQLHDSDEEKDGNGYHSLSIQLLDLMHTLHTRAATIFSSWAEEECKYEVEQTEAAQSTPVIDAGTSTLWTKCWCPLLQGIACLCCDSRRQVRSQALTYLQRALLVHDLQTLSAFEWESCFNKVLFPLLSKLLEAINVQDPSGIEETRMRASTLLCKVFLQHLTPLLSLTTFTALWLTILDFMDKYMHADRSDLLCEAIPESLKNMLLVMHTAGILQNGNADDSQLWKLTWDRIDTFLPNLRDEVFKPHELSEMRRQSRGESPPTEQQQGTAMGASDQSQHEAPATQKQYKQQQYYEQQYAQQAYQYAQQQHAAAAQQCPSSAVPVHGAAMIETADVLPANETNPEVYLTSTGAPVLHPPLPNTVTSTVPATQTPVHPTQSVPLLLDPDIIQSTNIPILSPQNTPDKASTEVVTDVQ